MIEEIFVDEENNREEEFKEDVLVKDEKIKPKIKFGDIVFNRKVKVFAKVNNEGFITDIESDVFLKDTTGWTLIGEGSGDNYTYPQTLYFGESIIDDAGNYKFKI